VPVSTGTQDRLSPIQLTGLLCWRGGLLLVASYSFFRIARLAVTHVDLAPQLQVALSLGLAGAAMVLGSLVFERVRDARYEEDLRE